MLPLPLGEGWGEGVVREEPSTSLFWSVEWSVFKALYRAARGQKEQEDWGILLISPSPRPSPKGEGVGRGFHVKIEIWPLHG